MIIWAFSEDFSFTAPVGGGTSCLFSQYKAKDTWPVGRSPILQPVGGAAGAFDFLGDDNYPPQPLVVSKKFVLTASTYIGVETALAELRAATIAANRGQLWLRDRDAGSPTYRWAWAKCTNLRYGEAAGENYLTMPVDVSFTCPEGLWYCGLYAETANGSGSKQVTNSGNYPALARLRVYSGGTNPTFSISGVCSASWNGTTSGSGLDIKATEYSCINNGVDAYDDLTLGSGQVAWFWIPPGTHTVTVTMTGSAGWEVGWSNTYV